MAGVLYIDTSFAKITVKPVHPTFGAEIEVPDWKNVDDDTVREISRAANKYAFCIFRNTGLDDTDHVKFSQRLGELDNVKRFITGDRTLRYQYYELFDAGNIADDGSLLDPNSARGHTNRGNQLFHTDSSYNFRRAGFSLLRAVELPPKGTGGHTEFADTRTAFVELPDAVKKELVKNNYVGCHTLAHSRKMGSPEYFENLDPSQFPMARHYLAQIHEGSGRVNLYVGAHLHHIEGLSDDESTKLRDFLNKHVEQPKYVYTFNWEQPGDMVMWDNRATLHRAAGGSFAGKYRRDLRRTTVHDDSANAWGLNDAEGASALGYQLDDKTQELPELTPANAAPATNTPAPAAIAAPAAPAAIVAPAAIAATS
ncbi:hypothetical protein QBC33DRAFT_581908 [Phialemonium atrogriseum]|uniref:TauD/TfdA-like domain-containing protein n=1 Tax=Phialemonium atrogriseum TaxID=1093897 RepID=A0AAJ0FIJ9_9PEZI|nr:uncharacterized protein QBC33DRAFT_581908 [Phialemonium atrogriseum]KAK1762180.1 hypothetical protein QBC33DRAFT_581908 [Phialemonium atrogriseum]